MRGTTEQGAHLALFKLWMATGITSALVWPWVVRSFARIPEWRFAFVASFLYSVDLLLQLLLPYGIVFSKVEALRPVILPGLGVVEFRLEGIHPSWAPLLVIAPLALCAFGTYAAVRLWRAGDRARAFALVFATVVEVGFVVCDALAVVASYRIPYLSDFGFIVFAFVLAVVIADEVSEGARLKEFIARSEDRLRGTLEAMTDAVFALDRSGNIVEANASASRLVQKPLPTMIGTAYEEVVQLASADEREAPKQHVRRGDGSERSVLRTRTESGHGTVVVLRDVTQQEALEDRLKRKQKMESLGELAGGVAHDFNNLLTGIGGAVELLRETVVDEDGRDVLLILESAVERAATLTRGLLTFSRGGRGHLEPTSIGAIVEEVAALLRRTVAPSIQVEVELRASPDIVVCDASEVHRALLNLAINARDAMPKGGHLRFTTKTERRFDDGPNRFGFRLDGAYVVVEVEDTGSGMNEELLDQIFTPFFTTKAVGTGLGLATVWGTVEQLGGGLEVTSDLGRGTRFALLLPAEDAPARAAAR